MKKALFIGSISVLLATLLVIILFAFCSNTMKPPAEKVNFDILNISDATKEDFEKYNCAFSPGNVGLYTENYKLVKVKYKFTNNNDFSVCIFNEKVVKNDDFYLIESCIDLEPTYDISSNSSLDIDVYVYVNKGISKTENMIEILKNIYKTFTVVRVK